MCDGVAWYRLAVSVDDAKALLGEASSIAEAPNYWLPASELLKPAPDRGLLCFGEHVVCSLFDGVVRELLGDRLCEMTGAEWWLQVRPGTRGMAFHFDKDEHLMEAEGRIRTPLLSSILYLNGEGSVAVSVGPTVVMEQRYDNDKECTVPAVATRSTILCPEERSYAVFDGSLAHGVLCGSFEGERVTFLVNYWVGDPPQNIKRCTEQDVATFHFTPAPNKNKNKEEEEAAVPVGLPTVTVPAPAADAVPIDMLAFANSAGVPLQGVGEEAVSDEELQPGAVIDHDGWQLWQLETGLIALVPTAMVHNNNDNE